MSTHNICFYEEIRKLSLFYCCKNVLPGTIFSQNITTCHSCLPINIPISNHANSISVSVEILWALHFFSTIQKSRRISQFFFYIFP